MASRGREAKATSTATFRCSSHKRWSQHIVASAYDDVCVLLKYQRRHHSQEDLAIITEKPSKKTYSTLTYNYRDNDSDGVGVECDVANHIDSMCMSVSDNNNNNVHLNSRNNNSKRNEFKIQNVTDTVISGLTINNTTITMTATSKHYNHHSKANVNGHVNGKQQLQQVHPVNGIDCNASSCPERRKIRLIRPISCFQTGDHVCRAVYTYSIQFYCILLSSFFLNILVLFIKSLINL